MEISFTQKIKKLKVDKFFSTNCTGNSAHRSHQGLNFLWSQPPSRSHSRCRGRHGVGHCKYKMHIGVVLSESDSMAACTVDGGRGLCRTTPYICRTALFLRSPASSSTYSRYCVPVVVPTITVLIPLVYPLIICINCSYRYCMKLAD